MAATGYGLHGTWAPGVPVRMVLRWLASLRTDISVGPSWIGRVIGGQLLDWFLPGRDRYIPPALPRYPATGGGQYTPASEAELADARRRLNRHRQAALEDAVQAELNACLHANPDVMRSWMLGWPEYPPGNPR